MKTLFIILLCSLIIVLNSANRNLHAQQDDTWSLKKERDGVEIFVRWREVAQDQKVRQLRAVMHHSGGSIDNTIKLIKDDEAALRWVNRAVQFYSFDIKNEHEWFTYSEISIPWPFENKDLITHNRLVRNETSARIELVSRPEKVPEKQKISRIELFNGEWLITANSKNDIKIEYLIMTEGPPLLPTWISDPLVENALIKTMLDMRAELDNILNKK